MKFTIRNYQVEYDEDLRNRVAAPRHRTDTLSWRLGNGRIFNDFGFFFTFDLRPNTCCGIVELHSFNFVYGRDTSKEVEQQFANNFNAALRNIGESFRKGYAHLTFHREREATEAAQRPYFVRTIEAYPGAIKSPWRRNPNSGNDIQFWVLPI